MAASNPAGTTYGHDVSFKTAAVPGGVTIAAFPGTVTFGGSTTLSGHVLPPRPSHVAVTLQGAPSAGGPWIDTATSAITTSGAYSLARTARALAHDQEDAAARCRWGRLGLRRPRSD